MTFTQEVPLTEQKHSRDCLQEAMCAGFPYLLTRSNPNRRASETVAGGPSERMMIEDAGGKLWSITGVLRWDGGKGLSNWSRLSRQKE